MKNVIIVCAAIGAVATFGSTWIFYTRTDGRLLEQRVQSVERVVERQLEGLNTLAGTINAVLIQQAKQGELSIRLSEALERLEKKE